MNKIIEVINSIILSVLSCFVYDDTKNIISKTEEKRRQEKFTSWISKFFSAHIEVVFESSQFEHYLRYNKPFEKIGNYILEAHKNNVEITEENFINDLAKDCKKTINDQGGKCSSNEESSIRELFSGVLSLIKNELSTNFRDGEQLLSFQINQNHIQLKDIQSQLNSIGNNFSTQTQVADPLTIENAYHLMSKAILQGKFEMVYSFLPVIKGKNEDLEKSIKIKLNILSNSNIHIENQYAELSSIINPVLRDDIIRTLIVEYYSEPDKIVPLVELISNETLKEIAKAVSENHIEEIISKKVSDDNGATAITFEILKNYYTEKVLVNKLLALYISALKVRGYKLLKETIVEPDIFDALYIWECCFYETILFCSGSNYGENKELKLLLEETKKNAEKYYNVKTTYAVRFYSLLLKIECLVCPNEFKETLAIIPEHILNEPEIAEIQMAYNIHTNTVSSDDVIEFSIKHNRYGVIIEYCNYLNNNNRIIEFINKALLILEKDFHVFIIYVDAISKVKGKKEAFSLLKQYETNYSIYPAFWISAYMNSENEDDKQWAVNTNPTLKY